MVQRYIINTKIEIIFIEISNMVESNRRIIGCVYVRVTSLLRRDILIIILNVMKTRNPDFK